MTHPEPQAAPPETDLRAEVMGSGTGICSMPYTKHWPFNAPRSGRR
jgi:hypothetical protein